MARFTLTAYGFKKEVLLLALLAAFWPARGHGEIRHSLTQVEASSCAEEICYQLTATKSQVSQLGDIMYFEQSSGEVKSVRGEVLYSWSGTPSYIDFKNDMLVIPHSSTHAESRHFQLQK